MSRKSRAILAQGSDLSIGLAFESFEVFEQFKNLRPRCEPTGEMQMLYALFVSIYDEVYTDLAMFLDNY